MKTTKLAYLVPRFPDMTHAFFWREVRAMRDLGIDVIAFDPGAVRTDLARHLCFPMSWLFAMVSFFMPRRSRTAVHAVTSPDLNGHTGVFVARRGTRPLSFDAAYKARVRDVTIRALPFTLERHVIGSQRAQTSSASQAEASERG